jgi:hypothetical protein
MALMGGHRFAVSMADAFPHGLYAMGVEQAQDYNESNKSRTPSRDKQTNDLVWTVTCIDRDPDARVKEVKIKVLAPHSPELPEEIVPGSGLRLVEFSGMTVTPYVDEGRGRARLTFSFRATGVHAQGKAPASSATQAGRPGGQAPGQDSKAA